MQKSRIDLLLVKNGMAESRSKAQALVMAGQVKVNGELVQKPSDRVDEKARISITESEAFVSRGGYKLLGAIESFGLDVNGKVCADVGASTGGFTDCLLQHGAEKVYAIDVGYGVLHWKLRRDPRVVVIERTNARYLDKLPELMDLVTVDASFISLNYLLPVILRWLKPGKSQVIALIKPQFEAGRKQAGEHAGVIKDAAIHAEVLRKVLTEVERIGFSILGLIASPIKGPKGNIEFLVNLSNQAGSPTLDLEELIWAVIETVPGS